MPCETVQLGDGTVAIACTGRRRSRRCVVCGELGADRLCDYPAEWRSRYGKRQAHTTCDKPLHRRCAKADGPHDYCPGHPPHGQAALAL